MAFIQRKIGEGRRKVIMEKIHDQSKLQVAFSKRRSGLFKKASELCTLTGAEVAIIVNSPGGKAFSFGHPSVQNIAQKTFPNANNVPNYPPLAANDESHLEAQRNFMISDYNAHLLMLDHQIEYEKKRGVLLEEKGKVEQAKSMWKEPLENLEEHQLKEMAMVLVGFKEKVMQAVKNRKTIIENQHIIHPAEAINNQMATTNPPPNHLCVSGYGCQSSNSEQATNASAINIQGIVPWSGNM